MSNYSQAVQGGQIIHEPNGEQLLVQGSLRANQGVQLGEQLSALSLYVLQANEIKDIIDHDCQQLINGLQQQNVFLVQQALPNVQHHIQLLDSLLPQIQPPNEEPLSQMKNFLQQLVNIGSANLVDLLGSSVEDKSAVALTSDLDVDLVVHLRKTGLPWSKIGHLFSLSRQSMYNFRKRNGIEEPNVNLDDPSLEALLPGVMQNFPAAGGVMMRGILLSMGYQINVNRVKAAMKRVDPLAVHMRKRQRIPRRVYSVPRPNFLWHMDGTHKTVMFRIIVHGCIDGFSHCIIFLECSTNNCSETVLNHFLGGVDAFGVPSRVRADHGGENFSVREFMLAVMGEGRGSFIMGPSVHNQRIERLWRDLNEQVTNIYKGVFLFLENEDLLDELNILDVFCLHFIYLPRMSNAVTVFKHGWNKHSMRTESSRTPEQLWLTGMIKEGFDVNLNEFKLDLNYDAQYWCAAHANTFHNDFDEHVLNHLLGRSLLIVPNPLEDDGNSGVSLYVRLRSTLLTEQVLST